MGLYRVNSGAGELTIRPSSKRYRDEKDGKDDNTMTLCGILGIVIIILLIMIGWFSP